MLSHSGVSELVTSSGVYSLGSDKARWEQWAFCWRSIVIPKALKAGELVKIPTPYLAF